MERIQTDNNKYLKLLALLFVISPLFAFTQDLTRYVNPFIGTGGHGHTYPGATVPFGAVQLSPDTRLEGWDGCSGYHYSDSVIYGFSHTHLSGTGVSDYGDILLMPTKGALKLNNGSKLGVKNGYASSFSHDEENARPGYYIVNLKDYSIEAHLTTTARCGFHQYNFDTTETNLILDLNHRDKLRSVKMTFVNNKTVVGWRVSEGWASKQYVYFAIKFSEPARHWELKDSTVAGIQFTLPNKELKVKVGISAVSVENALLNLNTEIPHWDFHKTKQDAKELWEKELSKIKVTDYNEENLNIFYSALYHSMIAPNIYNDVNGEYRGTDNRIHKIEHRDYYTVFSLWDTFRATHPLYTLIDKKRTLDFIHTFLRQYEQGGKLPIWELAANYTGCMIGYHAIPVIADAYVKEITEFDKAIALKAMRHSATQKQLGLEPYIKRGYIDAGEEPESVSKTLEYAYDDWCIAQMALRMRKNDVYEEYIKRAQSYKHLYDPNTGFFRARISGKWYAPFDPSEVNYNYTEANGWQYSLFVPHDIETIIDYKGGDDAFEKFLDDLFSAANTMAGRNQADITGLIGQYAHGNEPSHHMAYLYNYAGVPWKTQSKVAQIMREMYQNQPNGLSGNEDCGQMSSWYVWSAMGLYPVTPGDSKYAIGTPLFNQLSINLESGRTFTIKANNLSKDNIYIQSAALNGNQVGRSFIRHDEIKLGGTLVFEMGDKPNKELWQNKLERPPSKITTNLITPAPYFEYQNNTFANQTSFNLGCLDKEAKIMFQLNPGESYKELLNTVEVTESCNPQAYAISAGGDTSSIISTSFIKIKEGRSLELKSKYASQYAAGGDQALIDYQRGNTNYRTGGWQGFEGQDFEAFITFDDSTEVNTLSLGCLQDIKSWIFFPSKVSFYAVEDSVTYTELGVFNADFPSDKYGSFKQDYTVKLDYPRKLKKIQVVAKSIGDCPEWHLGAGGSSWIFLDELIVN